MFEVKARHGADLLAGSMLEARFSTTSPVDPTAVQWLRSPRLCLLDQGGTCGVERVPVAVPVEIFPVSSATGPRRASDRFGVPDGGGDAGL